MIDNVGKNSLETCLEPYKYRGKVEIPILGFVDDKIAISETGYKSERINTFVNTKTATKKLQYGTDKCYVMYMLMEVM